MSQHEVDAGLRGHVDGQRDERDVDIAGEDLAPLKARLLLMVALTKTQNPADIQRYFLEY